MASVGIIGAGNMGLAMALRLIDRDWSVAVRDIDPAREALARQHGAQVHAEASSLARASTLLIVAVVDAGQTREVLLGPSGALHGLAPGAAVLLCPTIAPDDVQTLAEQLTAGGWHAVDAPMSGGPARARDGSMSMMVACSDAAFQAASGLLADLSSRLFRVGTKAGDGARTKLVNNLLATVNLVGAAEALDLARRLGLDEQRTVDVIEQSSGQSWIGIDRLRRYVAADPAVHAHGALLAKDSALALEAARRVGCSPTIGTHAAAVFAAACAQGLDRQDDALLCRWLSQQP
ncbi:MAG: NAD(P)-dependent oxidoreductase [Rubrivivax sp.]